MTVLEIRRIYVLTLTRTSSPLSLTSVLWHQLVLSFCKKKKKKATIMIISARYYLSGKEVNDSKFLKTKIRLFQNVNCFCVVAIQSAKTGQRRETGAGGRIQFSLLESYHKASSELIT